MEDINVLHHIKKLIAEEDELYAKKDLTEDDIRQLHKLKIELDQYWDFLRQRRALWDAGANPDRAEVRDADIVENYEQ